MRCMQKPLNGRTIPTPLNSCQERTFSPAHPAEQMPPFSRELRHDHATRDIPHFFGPPSHLLSQPLWSHHHTIFPLKTPTHEIFPAAAHYSEHTKPPLLEDAQDPYGINDWNWNGGTGTVMCVTPSHWHRHYRFKTISRATLPLGPNGF